MILGSIHHYHHQYEQHIYLCQKQHDHPSCDESTTFQTIIHGHLSGHQGRKTTHSTLVSLRFSTKKDRFKQVDRGT